jgi:RimJ/RimL family protein N-acetyltransferase
VIVFGEHVCRWVAKRTGGSYIDGSGQGIGLEKDGQLVAGVMYDQFNGRAVQMHVAAIGRNWLNREYLWTCFDYPFNQLKVNKIVGLVDSNNADARRFDEHIGFQLAAVIPDAGKTGDQLIYSMTRHQCRWLGVKHGKSRHAART